MSTSPSSITRARTGAQVKVSTCLLSVTGPCLSPLCTALTVGYTWLKIIWTYFGSTSTSAPQDLEDLFPLLITFVAAAKQHTGEGTLNNCSLLSDRQPLLIQLQALITSTGASTICPRWCFFIISSSLFFCFPPPQAFLSECQQCSTLR